MSLGHNMEISQDQIKVDPNDDELQDLSTSDAQELRTFVEKRKWFESRLAILTGLPPIYPFLHPVLVELDPALKLGNGDLPFRHKSALMSKWKLPTRNQVDEWKKERDSLEDEVIRFDGGDLGRMKEKTMAATLLPLTPPSTHLVSITLALILLIDKLLSLLRHRMELLELTSLRLQWDALRWEVMEERRKIRLEIASIVQGKGKWEPPKLSSTISETNGSRRSSYIDVDWSSRPPMTPMTPRDGTAALHTSSSTTSPSFSGLQSSTHTRSSSHSSSPSKRATHLPVLHSHLLNLKIRHKNLVTTSLTRSGATLDRMIDVAGALKDLGGVDGPLKSTEYREDEHGTPTMSPVSATFNGSSAYQNTPIDAASKEGAGDYLGGAVPELLLDLQDEVDGDVEELGIRVAWCQELKEQWAEADKHYTSSTKARDTASSLTQMILNALDQPASSQTHKDLERLYERALSTVPRPIGHSFPRPSHSAYPEIDAHSILVVETLESSRKEAETQIDKAKQGLEWYHSLLMARTALVEQRKLVEDLQTNLDNALQHLLKGDGKIQRPNLSLPETLNRDVSYWATSIPPWTDRARSVLKESGEVAQKSTLAIMKYRHILKAAPKDLKLDLGDWNPPDDCDDELEKLTDKLLDIGQRTTVEVSSARLDLDILPHVIKFLTGSKSVTGVIAQLSHDIESATIASTWSTLNSTPVDSALVASIEQWNRDLTIRIDNEIVSPLQVIEDIFRKQERSIPTLQKHLSQSSAFVRRSHEVIQQHINLLVQISKQKMVLQTLEGEAAKLYEKIAGVKADIEGSSVVTAAPSKEEGGHIFMSQDMATLEREVLTWQESLSERVVFVTPTNQHNAFDGASHAAPGTRTTATPPLRPLLSPTTTASIAPITPPASPQSRPTFTPNAIPSPQPSMPDLEILNHSVRSHVNELSARVSAGVTDFKHTLVRLQFASWSHEVLAQIEEVKEGLEQWNAHKLEVDKKRAKLWLSKEPDDIGKAEEHLSAVEAFCLFSADLFKTSLQGLGDTSQGLSQVWAARPQLHSKLPSGGGPAFIGTTSEHEALEETVQKTQSCVDTARSDLDTMKSQISDLMENANQRLESARLAQASALNTQEQVPSDPHFPLINNDLSPGQAQPDEDVFGPRELPRSRTVSNRSVKPSSPIVPDSERRRIISLSKQLDSLNLDLIVFPTSTALESSPYSRHLPTESVAQDIKDRLEDIGEAVAAISLPAHHAAIGSLESLRHALTSKQAMIPRLDLLAVFATSIKEADTLLSDLLDVVDRHQAGNSMDPLHSTLGDTSKGLMRVRDSAMLVETDMRVTAESRRVLRAWTELSGMVAEILNPGQGETSELDDEVSEIGSISRSVSTIALDNEALQEKALPNLGRVAQMHTTNRSVSTPVSHTPTRNDTPKGRIVSDTPTRSRVESMRHTSQIPRIRKDSLGQGRSGIQSPGPVRAGPSSIPRPRIPPLSDFRSSIIASPVPSQQARQRLSSRPNLKAPEPLRRKSTPKTYVADPQSKLDVAVGNIVNKLNVNVPIVPVGLSSGDQWKDQSGRYWIGAEGRAKLCFCRILRSRTVMVRVGGGWVELSKFLLDHFADAIGSWQTPFPEATSALSFNAPIVITSATLASTSTPIAKTVDLPSATPTTTNAEQTSENTKKPLSTPTRPFPTSISANSLLSPTSTQRGFSRSASGSSLDVTRKSRTVSPNNPGSLVSSPGGLASPGGGLLPLHFMKKASESPEAREREKEGLRVGRRSILGREGI